MTSGADENKNKELGRGFAGISSLVSDVDSMRLPISKSPNMSPAGPQADATGSTSRTTSKQRRLSDADATLLKSLLFLIAFVALVWIIVLSLASTSSKGPAYTSDAQSAGNVNSGSQVMEDDDGDTFRVPNARRAELEEEKRAAMSAQRDAQNIGEKVERQGRVLREEKAQIDEQKLQLEERRRQIDQERLFTIFNNQREIDSFNLKVHYYNKSLKELQRRIYGFNDKVARYNSLFERAKLLRGRTKKLIQVYNENLKRYGVRQ